MFDSYIKSRSRFIWMFVVLIMINFSAYCQQQQQQQQYDMDQNQQQQQKQQQYEQENDDHLLSIQRQILRTEQMVKLYTQKLSLLYELKNQQVRVLKMKGRNKNDKEHKQQQLDKNTNGQMWTGQKNKNQKQQQGIAKNYIQNGQRYNKDNPYHILTNQYKLQTTTISSATTDNQQTKHQHQHQQNNHNNNNKKPSSSLKQQVIILPPFIINKLQSYVTLIDNLDQVQERKIIGSDSDNIQSDEAFYDYSHATRLLFYQLEKQYNGFGAYNKHKPKKHPYHNSQQSIPQQNQQQQTHTLNLVLQIKPNNIKTVTITCIIITNPNNNRIVNQSKFLIQQKVTSYQSHQLITQTFKWHHALQFDNLIIGYKDSTIYIKEKQTNNIIAIDINYNNNKFNGKVLALYSINQYKVVYVSQYTIGIINVRSYLINVNDEIRYEYYLGNRTAVMRGRDKGQQNQYQSDENNNKLDEKQYQQMYQQQQQLSKLKYWHPPYTRQFNLIRALSVQRIPQTKQLLILLSNGQMLLYGNGKILHGVNIQGQVMREFWVKNNKQQDILNSSNNNSNNNNDLMEIKINLLPGYTQAILTSNKHNKLLIYNISIPQLTRNRNNDFFAFLQPKVNTFKFQYWMAIDIDMNVNNKFVKTNNNKGVIQQLDIQVCYQSYTKSERRISSISNSNQQKQIVIYLSYMDFYQSKNQPHQQTHTKTPTSPSFTKTITIQQHRLLLPNLLQQQHSSSILTNSLSQQNNDNKSSSYWWKFLMIVMVVLGVLCFKKCKQYNSNKLRQQEEENMLYQLPLGYGNKKRGYSPLLSKKANDQNNPNKFIKNKRDNITKTAQTINQQYQQKVISQLQSYFQKQGQKLTKSQIIQLVQQIQAKQSQQQIQQQQRQQQHSKTTRQQQLEGYQQQMLQDNGLLQKRLIQKRKQQQQQNQKIKQFAKNVDNYSQKKKKR